MRSSLLIRILFLLLALLSTLAFAQESSDADGTPCCILFVIVMTIALAFASKKFRRSGSSLSQLSDLELLVLDELHIKVDSGKKDFGGVSMECFFVRIRGSISLPSHTLDAAFSLSMWDVTLGIEDDMRKHVLCSIPELQIPDSQIFLWTHVRKMRHSDTLMKEWIEVLSIPIDLLTFPARGNRGLFFEISVAPLVQIQNSSVIASFTYEHFNKSPGYVDGIKMRIKAEELGLKYAVAVSTIDGIIDDEEKAVVRKWMDSRIESLPEDMRADTTRSLSRALMTAERLGVTIKPHDIEMLCEDMAQEYPISSFPKGELYDIIELCMQVAAADGIASPCELKLIDRIAALLGVDSSSFRTLSEKILPVDMRLETDITSILGLKPEWTPRHKKRHLKEKHREWSRVTHSDARVRDQVDEMLRLIAEERAKIDAEK